MNWWYRKFSWQALLLLPFSILYAIIICLRYFLFRIRLFKTIHFNIPVIIIGNITVGGTGKTPFIIWLGMWLSEHGYRVGIVSRGYKSKAPYYPFLVDADTPVTYSGDEALLIAKRTKFPVAIAPKRVQAAKFLVEQCACNIILSDDGLQHYALGREYEFVILDGTRGLGNHLLFPAGPLREPASRLAKVDAVIINQPSSNSSGLSFNLIPKALIKMNTMTSYPLAYFENKSCHAVAGIGNPSRFFESLKSLGIKLIEHRFPDHHAYQIEDLQFQDELPIIMTEKDAIKCQEFTEHKELWYLSIELEPNECLGHWLKEKLIKTGLKPTEGESL